MTLAIVTDINEYRAKKESPVLSSWSDAKLKSRYTMLKHIENGADFLTDSTNPLVRRAFPTGFDADEHVQDNIDKIREEANRRGVNLT